MMEQQADRGGRFLFFSVLNSENSFLPVLDVLYRYARSNKAESTLVRRRFRNRLKRMFENSGQSMIQLLLLFLCLAGNSGKHPQKLGDM